MNAAVTGKVVFRCPVTRQNAGPRVIKQALGHKSIVSTAIYTVPTDETAGKAVTAGLASMF
jgi:hypothetical protein